MKLNSSGILLNEFAITILSSELFKVSNQKKQIAILVTPIKEIGFSKGATLPQIERKIKNYGLSECPLEVAPYLRIYLNNQKIFLDTSFIIATAIEKDNYFEKAKESTEK